MTPRELSEGPGWEASLRDVGLNLKDADQLLLGVTFEIALIPGRFPYVRDTSWQVAQYIGTPSLWVVFQHREGAEHIELLFVVPVEAQSTT